MIRQATFIVATTVWLASLAGILASTAAPANAQAAPAAKPASFTCTGVKIEPVSFKQSPITVKLALTPGRKISLNLDNSDVKNSVTSDDQTTLRFRSRDFTGEFFRFTNDLFLIYHSGHLAKHSCAPAQ
ncbi:MAG: hypothetical protein WBD83_19355 [Xanthobacteraceae bacterium]|jgi:hypothetical protein